MNKIRPINDGQTVFHYSTDDRVNERTGLHVWLLNLDQSVSSNALLGALSLDEWSRANLLKDNLERNRFLVRCLFLRIILSSLTGLPPASFQFGKDSCGKPRLKGFPEHPSHSTIGLSFSISHTEDLLAVAVGFGQEVGVDVEKVSRDLDHEQVVRANFAREDVVKLRSLPVEQRSLAFYRLWTQKEAVGKMEGNGILPSGTTETGTATSVHLHSFEYTHNGETVLGAVALGEMQSGPSHQGETSPAV
jgi:phosphopantetheinyl transferase